jgi:translocation and assembly module TamB
MSHSQGPRPGKELNSSKSWLNAGLAVGSIVFLSTMGLAWRGWVYANNNLSRLVSEQLSDALDRPVEVGELEYLSFSGVGFGPSAIPSTPTDPDFLTIDSIELQFDLLDLLTGTLRPTFTLHRAEAYIEQAANGRWVTIPPQEPEPEGPQERFFKVRPTIHLTDSDVTLVPYVKGDAEQPVVDLTNVQASLQFTDTTVEDPYGSDTDVETLTINLDGRATSTQQGRLEVSGAILLPPPLPVDMEATSPGAEAAPTEKAKTRAQLNVRTQNLQSTDLLPIIEAFLENPLPVQFPTGTISGTADLAINGEIPFSIVGTARVDEATLVARGLPEPLRDLEGDMQFNEQLFEFEGVTARMGELSAQGEGTLDLQGEYDLNIQIDPFTAKQAAELFDLKIPAATEGRFTADLAMTGPLNAPVLATDLASLGQVTIDRVPFSEITGTATLQPPELVFNALRAVPVAGGLVTGTGTLKLGDDSDLALTLTGEALPADALGRPYGLAETVTIGDVDVDMEITGPPEQLVATARWRAPTGDFPARGDIRISGGTIQFTDTFAQLAGGTIGGDGTLVNRQWNADVRARNLRLNQLLGRGPGLLDADARLSGSLDNFNLGGIQGQGTATATLVGGVVTGQGELAGGQWTADLQGNDLQLAAFSPALQGTGSGTFNVSGNVENLSLAGIQGQGRLVLSDGLATAASVAPQLAAVREPLTADLAWNGQVIQVQQANTSGIQVDGVITPQLEGAGAPRIANVDLNLNVDNYNLAALPLPALLPVRGQGSFDGRLTGSLATLNLTGSATLMDLALGELDFAPSLNGPVLFSRTDGLTVDLEGGQDRIYVVTNQGDRDLDFLVRNGEALAEGYVQADNLFAQIDNLPLDGLKLPPSGVDGIGTVSGTIDSATIRANLREPTLSATFDIVDPGIGYISLQTVEVDPATEEGAPNLAPRPLIPADATPDLETRYGRLRGTLGYGNGVISLVGADLESASGMTRYQLSGTYTLGEPPKINGEMVVQNGQIQDILLTFKIFELSDFRLNPFRPPAWFGPVTEAEVAALQPQQVGDRNASMLDQLRRLAEVLALQDIRIAQEEAAPLPPLDELTGSFSGTVTAKGPLTEAIRLEANLRGRDWVWGDPTNPQTASYHVNYLLANASYEDSVVSFQPIQLSSLPPSAELADEQSALVQLNGEFSLDREDPVARSLTLNVANVDLDTLRRPFNLPSTVNGQLNVGATLTGSLDNPQIRGQLEVADATINRNLVEQASATFLYKDARLNLIGDLSVDDAQTDPLTLTASIPYQLPVATRPPDSQNLSIDLAVENEGFAVLNLFTDTFTWESGEARMDLAIRGILPQDENLEEALTSLSVGGSANLRGVTISSTILPEPLTNIRGDILVVNDSGTSLTRSVYGNGLALDFNNVRGDFSDGEVVAEGNLTVIPSINELFPGIVDTTASTPETAEQPENDVSTAMAAETDGDLAEPSTVPDDVAVDASTSSPGPASTPAEASTDAATPEPLAITDQPFQLSLSNIDLTLEGLYRGEVNGQVFVDGSLFLLAPEINGEILLTDGVISLPDATPDGNTTALLGGNGNPGGDVSIYKPLPPVFDNFQLSLGNNVSIVVPGLVDVLAEGSLALVGTVPDVRPVGRINLPDGRINLLTTAFRLTGNENYAEFRATDTTIDPYLVANLVTVVPDTAGTATTLSVASPFPRNEISDVELNQLGLTQSGVESVRIRANVEGRVSRVTQLQGVELTSSPPRSEGEIVSLISGGILTALESTIGSVSGGGDNFQGLIAVAGSALLTRIQGVLGDALSISELRLFSATPPSAQNTGDLDFGGEIGFNVSPNISVSVQKVFTNITPAVFNVRYRINNNLTLRGITSYEQFNENTGVILEIQL